MEVKDILKELEYNKGYFPEKVLKEAISRKEEISDDLLQILKNTSQNLLKKAGVDYYFAHIYAMYLLAQFRDERAYPVLIELITGSQEEVDVLLGDLITEDLGNILASVYNGDLTLLYNVIEDNNLDQFIRGAASKALLVLAAQNIISREELMEYYRGLLKSLISNEEEGEFLSLLIIDCCTLHPEEVMEEVETAFEEDLVFSGYINWSDIQSYYNEDKDILLEELKENKQYRLIFDTISSLNRWACFRQDNNRGEINRMNNLLNKDLNLMKFWTPSKESAKKINCIQIECFYNIFSDKLNGKNPFEFLTKERNLSVFFNKFPLIKESQFYDIYMQYSPLEGKEFKYTRVYDRTGGVLNLFNTNIKKNQDKVLKKLFKDYSKKEVIRKWIDISNELWNGLTPGMVWAGGGKIEAKLLNDFLEYLSNKLEGQGFVSEEEAVDSARAVLDDWQHSPNSICEQMTPFDAIVEERTSIHNKKKELIDSLEIKSDFV